MSLREYEDFVFRACHADENTPDPVAYWQGVQESQRAVALYKGKLRGILTPGEHRLRNERGRLEIEWHDLARPEFVSAFEKALSIDAAFAAAEDARTRLRSLER